MGGIRHRWFSRVEKISDHDITHWGVWGVIAAVVAALTLALVILGRPGETPAPQETAGADGSMSQSEVTSTNPSPSGPNNPTDAVRIETNLSVASATAGQRSGARSRL
ncbi:MAG: hypothetical protein GY788_13855 [bacterium]|nr:hypothetical protein [bacterium]